MTENQNNEMIKQTEEESINSLLIELGLVFFISQSVEFNLVTLLGMAKKSGDLKSEKNVRELMNTYFSRTMGSIKRSVSDLIDINEELEELLKITLETRNWLAHNFFREYSPATSNENYRINAKIVLKKAKDIFEKTNELIKEEIILQSGKCGITEEQRLQMNLNGMNNYINSEKSPNEMWDEPLNKTSWQKYRV